MRKLFYSFQISLDGYIADRDGDFAALAPDEEVHRFHNEQAREVGVHVCGRRLYEIMRYWDTADRNPGAGEVELEFARIWQATTKLVFSRTLDSVGPGATLVRGDLVAEVAKLKAEPGEGAIAVGGAELAAELIRAGLVDELRPVIHPVLLGGGTPFLPALDAPAELELAETRRFASGVVYVRYLA